jgi:hypothetical protein
VGSGLVVTGSLARPFPSRTAPETHDGPTEGAVMGILWIILIVVVVLALFGFIGRGYW